MLRYVIFGLICFGLVYGASVPKIPHLPMDWVREGRIIGGEDADIIDAPYQAALLFGYFGSFAQSCGGSIILPSVIVSAGHCPFGTRPSQWRIRVGSTYSNRGGQVVNVQRFTIHEQYSSTTIDYDISLLFLEFPIRIDGVQTASIPLPLHYQQVSDGELALITGWGSTREGGSTITILQKVTIPIVNQRRCRDAYSNYNDVTDRMLCAGNIDNGGADACQGDSGGPLAVNGVLIGVTSWGRGCARPRYPGVFTRVPLFRDWIDSNVKNVGQKNILIAK